MGAFDPVKGQSFSTKIIQKKPIKMVEKSQVDEVPPIKETNPTNLTYYLFFSFPISKCRCACEASIISHATNVGSFNSLATLSLLFSCLPPTLQRFLTHKKKTICACVENHVTFFPYLPLYTSHFTCSSGHHRHQHRHGCL